MKYIIPWFLVLSYINICHAQDNNILARTAYQNAEEAFSQGQLGTALAELNKVDAALGVYTPKSAYLRVQVWVAYAELNKANSAGALEVSKRYLDLHKAFPDMAEEKLIEVTNLVAKFKLYAEEYAKTKAIEDKQKNLERLKAERADILIPLAIKALDSLMLSEFKFKAGEILDSLVQRRPDVADIMKDKFKKPSTKKSLWSNDDIDKIGYKDYEAKGGISTIWLAEDKRHVIYFEEIILQSNNSKAVLERYNYYRPKLLKIVEPLSDLHEIKHSDKYKVGYFAVDKSIAFDGSYYNLRFNNIERTLHLIYTEKYCIIVFDTH